MSPTLLELIVVPVLLLLAWLIGILIAPWFFALVAFLWRESSPPLPPPTQDRPEKNVTPPPVPGEGSRKKS